MSKLEKLSDETLAARSQEIQEELRRRKERPISMPTPLAKPDFTALLNTIEYGVQQTAQTRMEDEDFSHFVYESAMEAVYGKAYWEWKKKL